MFLFIGAFILARAIFVHGLDRRLAYTVLSLPWVAAAGPAGSCSPSAPSPRSFPGGSPTRQRRPCFGIGLSILAAMRGSQSGSIDPRYPTALMLMTSFAASIGGLATPVGTPPNVIGIGFIRSQLGVDISFLKWMLIGVPAVLLLFGILYVLLNAATPPPCGNCRRGPRRSTASENIAGPLDPGPALGRTSVCRDGGALGDSGNCGPGRGRNAARFTAL